MESVCVSLGVVIAVWIPALAAFAVGWGVFSHRVEALERRVKELDKALSSGAARDTLPPTPTEPAPTGAPSGAPGPSPAPSPPLLGAPPPAKVRPAPPPKPPKPPKAPWKPPSPERIALWIAAGFAGLTLVLTVLLALVAVVERGWIGPAARVSGGLVTAVVLWVGGTVARRRWPWVGSALAGAGIGAAYGALFAGSSRYTLFGPTVASGAMIAVTALATARAAILRERFVAWLALIGGLLTPWLVSTGENRPISLFVYLSLLAVGVLASARRCGWPDLVIGAALGVAGLHAGWATQWYTAEQTGPALFGVAVLTLPFAFAATSRHVGVRIAAAVASALLPMLAAPWVVPVSTGAIDPRSGLWAVRSEPRGLWLAALATVGLPLPVVASARWWNDTSSRLHAALATLPAVVLGLAYVGGWCAGPEIESGWIVAGAVAGVAVAVVLAARSADTTLGLLPWLAVAGLALTITPAGAPPLAVAIGVLVLVASAELATGRTKWGGVPFLALFVLGLPLAVATSVAEDRAAVVGGALIALTWLVQTPVRRTLETGRASGWTASALGGIALFPSLYTAWTETWGTGAIGLLPLLLSGFALLAAGALVRRARLSLDELVVAVFTLVVLLGITTAVPLQLEQRWLTVAWALEAGALAYVSRWIRHPLLRWTAVLLAAVVGVRLVLNPWALAWGSAEGWPILNWTLYTWGIPLVCILVVARFAPRRLPDGALDPRDPLRFAPLPLGVLASLVGFALVNVEVSHAFQDQGALELASADRLSGMVRSASWAAYGLFVLGLGSLRDNRAARLVGFAFVLMATVKVFLFDLWGLSGFVRVGSMGCLAVSLVLAAVAFERLVLRSTRSEPAEGG